MGLIDYRLDRLVKVPASQEIGGEATHFTPWLATNIDVLSDSLGLGLTIGEDNRLVLIEVSLTGRELQPSRDSQ